MRESGKQWAKLVGGTALRWGAAVLALLLIGFAYTSLGGNWRNALAIPAWFLKLSTAQWIALGVGLVAAFLMVALPCASITAGGAKRTDEWDRPVRKPQQKSVARQLAVLAILVLYFAGVVGAYHVSRALGHSRDWAIVHSVYSWLYVGFSLGGWLGDHRKQPLGRTLEQLRVLLGI